MYSFIKHILIGYGIGSLIYHIYSFCRFYFAKKKLEKFVKKLNITMNKAIETTGSACLYNNPEPLNVDFNKRKHEIAYNNKLERVKSKIEELKDTDTHKEMTKLVSGMILVDAAIALVEKERLEGKIDNLYSNNL